jgi:hypothetical protein
MKKIDEFKRGDVVVMIGEARWRMLIVDVKVETYYGVTFERGEKIGVFAYTHSFSKSYIERNYIKVCSMKVPRWL